MDIEKKATEEVLGLTKEVYADLAKPTITQVGNTTAGLARICLSPLNAVVWGFDRIVAMLDDRLSDKLRNVSKERLQTPPAFVAVPALEALRYTAEINELRDLYTNLLANAMDTTTVKNVHPSFTDVIKNLTPDEAKILRVFLSQDKIPYINVIQINDRINRSFRTIIEKHIHVLEDYEISISDVDLLAVYFENLVRIGILEMPEAYSLEEDKYRNIESCEFIIKTIDEIKSKGFIPEIQRRFFGITSFGRQFVNMVVKDK